MYSCAERAEYKILPGGRILITPKEMNIVDVDILSWRVGPGYQQTLSKGLRFKMSLPILQTKDLSHMITLGGINGWLLRVVRKDTFRSTSLGMMYVPLVSMKKSRSVFSDSQTEEGFFDVYYAAASPSKRFEKFNCPAFGHDKIIDKVEEKTVIKVLGKIVSGPVISKKVRGKVIEFGFRPALFNGGMSLEGKYYVELALYDYVNKIRRSDFIRYPEEIIVRKEQTKNIKGCARFKIPQRVNRRGAKDFKMPK